MMKQWRCRFYMMVVVAGLCVTPAMCYERAQGFCELGGVKPSTSGQISVTFVQGSYPSCTVTVYTTSTGVIVPGSQVFSDEGGTVLGNPFTADSKGHWFFYVADGTYDVKLSGGGLPVPWTIGAIQLWDSKTGLVNYPTQITNVPLLSVVSYGAVGDGTTDDTEAIQAAITQVASTGGIVFFPAPPVCYLVMGQLLFPNDGEAKPNQRAITLQGVGAGANTPEGLAHTPYGSSCLDLRYSGSGARIVTLGSGSLDIYGLAFISGGTTTTPFFLTTNTTVHIHDNVFQGNLSKVGFSGTTDEDAIILGGTTTNEDGSLTAAYQGYGSVIERNWFNHIRRGVYARVYANGVVIRDNTVWIASGGTADYGFIEFDGGVGGCIEGGLISGNIIETAWYNHPIRITYGCHMEITGNGNYDNTAFTLDYVYFGSLSAQNHVLQTLTPAGFGTVPVTDMNGSNSACDMLSNTLSCGTPRAGGIGIRGFSFGGAAVQGNETTGNGGLFQNNSDTAAAVAGNNAGSSFGGFFTSASGEGVRGLINSGSEAVAGVNTGSGIGIYGSSASGYGGFFTSTSGEAVRGSVTSVSEAVAGINTSATSVGTGVYGSATTATGGLFTSSTGIGLVAESTGGTGFAFVARIGADKYFEVDASGGILMPFLGSTNGKVFLCVDTLGLVTKNAAASCTGTP